MPQKPQAPPPPEKQGRPPEPESEPQTEVEAAFPPPDEPYVRYRGVDTHNANEGAVPVVDPDVHRFGEAKGRSRE